MMLHFMGNFMGTYDFWGYSGMGWGGGLLAAPLLLLLVLWTLYWKYQALWYAAKHDHKWWFIVLLVINTVGILEILYLYIFSKSANVSGPGHDEKNVPMVPSGM